MKLFTNNLPHATFNLRLFICNIRVYNNEYTTLHAQHTPQSSIPITDNIFKITTSSATQQQQCLPLFAFHNFCTDFGAACLYRFIVLVNFFVRSPMVAAPQRR